MPDVRVFFRPDQPIEVHHPSEFALVGEPIVWHLHTLDPKVTWAMIRFEEKEKKYFRNRPPGPARQHYRKTELVGGSSQILGTGPSLGPKIREDKYVIEGWSGEPPDPVGGKPKDSTSEMIVDLDPVIIISDP